MSSVWSNRKQELWLVSLSAQRQDKTRDIKNKKQRRGHFDHFSLPFSCDFKRSEASTCVCNLRSGHSRRLLVLKNPLSPSRHPSWTWSGRTDAPLPFCNKAVCVSAETRIAEIEMQTNSTAAVITFFSAGRWKLINKRFLKSAEVKQGGESPQNPISPLLSCSLGSATGHLGRWAGGLMETEDRGGHVCVYPLITSECFRKQHRGI